MSINVFKRWVGYAVFVGILGAGRADAQITLLHTMEGYATTRLVTGLSDFSGYFPQTSVGTSGTWRIYNEDFSIRTTLNISVPSGYQISTIALPSEKIFNADDKLEYLVTFSRTETDNPSTRMIMRLYNEDGIMLRDFGTANSLSAFFSVTSTGDYRLMVWRAEFDGVTTTMFTDIYSLPGRLQTSSIAPNSPRGRREATELGFNLKPGEVATLRIFDMRGRLIESREVDHTFGRLMLNTARYPRGMYVYRINGVSNRFVLK